MIVEIFAVADIRVLRGDIGDFECVLIRERVGLDLAKSGCPRLDEGVPRGRVGRV